MAFPSIELFRLLKIRRNVTADISIAPIKFAGFEFTGYSGYVCNQELEEDFATDDEESFFDLVFTSPDYDFTGVKVSSIFSNSCGGHADEKKPSPGDPNSKPLSPIALFKSAPNFRVFILGFTKSMATPSRRRQKSRTGFTKKGAEEAAMPSWLTRDNSLRSKLNEEMIECSTSDVKSKRFSKDMVHKCKTLMKPLYDKASRRSGGTKRFSDGMTCATPSSPLATSVVSSKTKVGEKQGSQMMVLKDVRKHLGKSRSASSTAAKMVPSPATRRDDTVVQQQDGIQSAILHCKRSYISSSRECSELPRSGSAPPHRGNSTEKIDDSTEDENQRCSI